MPLAGIPVSPKDTVDVAECNSSVGFSKFVGDVETEDRRTMKLLKDAGAVPYVKTNILVTLLSFESSNDVCGRSTNPYNNKYSPGDSTGREGALLTIGGRIGIGGNVAASIRCPGHALGIYSFKCSKGRWMKLGASTSILGQDGIPPAYSPMTRTLDDLTYFTQSVIWVQPLTYEYLTQFILCHGGPRLNERFYKTAGS